MHRAFLACCLSAFVLAATPAPALAADEGIPAGLSMGAGVVALLAAAELLVLVAGLRRIAKGGAIAERMTWVVLATLCLAASVLVGWIARFVPGGITAEQARMGADLLVIASMAFFGIYFWRVRAVLTRFVETASHAHERDHTEDPGV